MYSKVEYASWLKATYGLSESIRELVPMRKTPPLFCSEPCATVANAATVATTRATGHHFLISASSAKRRFFHGQRLGVRVERIPHPQRDGSEVLPMPERELVEDGHPERLQALLQHVLER